MYYHTWGVDQETRQARNPHSHGLLASVQQTGKTWRFACIFNRGLCKHSHALILLYLIGYDYNHSTVNHSEHFKDPLTGTHTNTIEGRYWYLCVGIEFDTICNFARWFCVKRQFPRSGNYDDLESYVSFWIFLLSFYLKVLARVYMWRVAIILKNSWR